MINISRRRKGNSDWIGPFFHFFLWWFHSGRGNDKGWTCVNDAWTMGAYIRQREKAPERDGARRTNHNASSKTVVDLDQCIIQPDSKRTHTKALEKKHCHGEKTLERLPSQRLVRNSHHSLTRCKHSAQNSTVHKCILGGTTTLGVGHDRGVQGERKEEKKKESLHSMSGSEKEVLFCCWGRHLRWRTLR